MSISYRTAEDADQQQILDLDVASSDIDLLNYTRKKGDKFLNIHEYYASGGSFWVAKTDNKIVGMVGLRFLGNGMAKVNALRVHPEYRKRGVAKKLMGMLEKYCEECDIKEIVLGVNKKTVSAIKLYGSLEYVKYDERKVNDEMTAIYYKKILI